MTSRTLVTVAMALALSACRDTQPPQTPAAIREALLASLTPVTLSNCTFTRVGSPNDGGYVMCANLMDGATAGYSYGIGGNDDWGCSIARMIKAPVHQYDCFEPPGDMACTGGQFVPHNECVGARAETIHGRRYDSITNQITRNGDAGRNLIVKIDVEGAEWDALLATPDEVLDRFNQLSMELHGTGEAHFVDVVKKLKRTFHVVNVHFNNWACRDDLAPFPAGAFQVLFVNKRLGAIGTPPPGRPAASAFDAPDNAKAPDCQLNSSP